ncbi:MAG: hypothetical protein H6898_02925 [Rhodobacter sp.]|nr:hypothetical protein [Paracoccaceae bacterium]MCC0075525.1 hypothetical protein [Rhodobacter sp.]
MSATKRKQKTQRRSRDRMRVYLYGSDRDGALAGGAAFAGGGCGAVRCDG